MFIEPIMKITCRTNHMTMTQEDSNQATSKQLPSARLKSIHSATLLR